MDLLAAMDLARRGKGQAEQEAASFRGSPPRSEDEGADGTPSEATATEDRSAVGPSAEIVPRLAPAEFRLWMRAVARAICEESGGSWYDLTSEQIERYVRLAEVAVRAVERATIDRTLSRLRPAPTGPMIDAAEAEIIGGLTDQRGRMALSSAS